MSPHVSDRPHPMRSLLILAGAALAFALAQTMLIPALGELARQLDTDASGIAWVLTGYLLAASVATPIVGKLYTLYYKLDTLLDSYTLLPQRGSVYSEHGGRHRYKVSRFDHAARRVNFEYESTNKATDNFPIPPYTQDVLSAIYVLRAVPLKAGDVITMPVTDDGTNYKMQVSVGAAERVKTPLSEVSAWKLKLSIFDSTGRPQGRNVAMWLSDDPRRLPMKFQAELPVGTFNLNLREVR